jgi:hypothetical protein
MGRYQTPTSRYFMKPLAASSFIPLWQSLLGW